KDYLSPLRKQGLIAETQGVIAETQGGYVVGPQWELIRPYQEVLRQASNAGLTLERIAHQGAWITREDLDLDLRG
ncbi:MAG: hypothetical protein ACUVSY_09420, partial [Roseiflexus sp.]